VLSACQPLLSEGKKQFFQSSNCRYVLNAVIFGNEGGIVNVNKYLLKVVQNYFQVVFHSHPSTVNEPLLFVYQSTFQRRLMVEFGAEVFFLDELCFANR
jgi:hypothetical protein